jgi:arginase
MNTPEKTTLRLLFPQWQGGNNAPYFLGAQLLNWLAPISQGPMEEVPVSVPDGKPLELEDGIMGRTALLEQLALAQSIIERHRPDRLVVLGGDCLVDLAPFAYLSERYGDDLAVLWVDAHPDVMTPREFQHAHAMVLGNLLGQGDADFAQAVKRPLNPRNVMYAGLQPGSQFERNFIQQHGLRQAGPAELAHSSEPVLQWLCDCGAKHLAIHFDLDVIDPTQFRGLLFAQPDIAPGTYDGVAMGRMSIAQVSRLLNDVSQHIDVVGMGVTEHLPWDALALKNMLAGLPLLRQS